MLLIYKAFIHPHLDYCDIIYDKPNNECFKNKIESVQYNAPLAITGCIRGTSTSKLYAELGLESLADRRLLHRLNMFYKIVNKLAPSYLYNVLTFNDAISVIRRNTPFCSLHEVKDGFSF